MVWGCISMQGVGKLRFVEESMDKKMYLNILENELTESAKQFGFYETARRSILKCKLYQDNDPKKKS